MHRVTESVMPGNLSRIGSDDQPRLAQIWRRTPASVRPLTTRFGDESVLFLRKRVGLRLARASAIASAKFANKRLNHKPKTDLKREADFRRRGCHIANQKESVVNAAPGLDNKDHGVLHIVAGFNLTKDPRTHAG